MFTHRKLTTQGIEELATFKIKVSEVVTLLRKLAPESRERSLAITKLEEGVFWAASAICAKEKNHNPKETQEY
jgi:hypothetical protein